MLVKIEDDKSDLISTFIERYKFLINKKFDEIFSMKEDSSEIDFNTYSKIYYNYEFSINENEFLFYENQIEQLSTLVNGDKLINLSNLPSKYFKKGTFIWICKKIQETIISYFVPTSFKYFTGLFDKSQIEKLNDLYSYMVEIFNLKVKDLMRKNQALDPTFFKEGLISFYYPFAENLQKIGTGQELADKILENNKILIKEYIAIFIFNFVEKIGTMIKSYIPGGDTNQRVPFNRSSILTDINSLFNQITQYMVDSLTLLKKLDFEAVLAVDQEEVTSIQFGYLTTFLDLFFFVLKSANFSKIMNTSLKSKDLKRDQMDQLRVNIQNLFTSNSKGRIYLKILLCKTVNNNLKIVVDRCVREFPLIKNNKHHYTDIRNFLDKENAETLNLLFDATLQMMDAHSYPIIKKLFFDENWLNYENAISYRLDLRDLCYELFYFKFELYDLLDEEKKVFEENFSTSYNETFLNKGRMKQTKFQKEMLCFNIRRLTIYDKNCDSPQMIMSTLAKIFLKVRKFI